MSNNGILIISIVNKGNSDLVMEGAKKYGAKGGTIFSARGTGNKELGQFFGIAIQPEKEIVLILTDEKHKEKILKGIYDYAGLKTQGAGISFSLRVEDTIGLDPIIEEINK